MSLHTCADCSTQYTVDLAVCPHCGSNSTITDEGVTAKRFPSFVTLFCPDCGRGPWTIRLNSATSGLIELPTLACASCGSRVPVTWPPEEEPMSPKITAHGGATNAHGADPSPDADVSQPLVGAEADQGLPTPVELDEVQDSTESEEDEGAKDVDYASMTLQELRDAATARDLPSYGTKAQVTERLKEADAAEDPAE